MKYMILYFDHHSNAHTYEKHEDYNEALIEYERMKEDDAYTVIEMIDISKAPVLRMEL